MDAKSNYDWNVSTYFFQELVELTPGDHVDFDALNEACQEVERLNVLTEMNRSMAEKFEKIFSYNNPRLTAVFNIESTFH